MASANEPSRLAALLKQASNERLLKLAALRLGRNESMLHGASVLPERDVQVMGEHRRYLRAFDAWLRDPSDENMRIRRAALRDLIVFRDG